MIFKHAILFSALCTIALAQPNNETITCTNGKTSNGRMSVQGSGSTIATPDKADVGFTVEVTRSNATRARLDAAKTTDDTMNALKTINGISPSDITTTSINLSPNYVYIPENSTNIIQGYTFSQTFVVDIKNLTADLLSSVIDTASSAGGNYLRISSVQTDLAPTTKLNALNEARKGAVNSASASAAALSSAAGVTLGPIVAINDQTSTPVPLPVAMPAAADGMVAAAKGPATPVSLGTTEVVANVGLEYALCPN